MPPVRLIEYFTTDMIKRLKKVEKIMQDSPQDDIIIYYGDRVFCQINREGGVPRMKEKNEKRMTGGQVSCEQNNTAEKNCGKYGEDEGLPWLMLHSCCGPCSTAVIERLMDSYNIKIFFYNPNITDADEYEKRKAAQIEVIKNITASGKNRGAVIFEEGEYRPQCYLDKVKGLENEPEGGARCTVCFEMRLEECAAAASMENCDLFGTTLTVSPHKNYSLISLIGNRLAMKYNVDFLDMDFKKKDGFRRSVEMSKEMGIYRQNFCGCDFSKWWEQKQIP